ncbi:sulfatase-like hydrolase/transferase [Planctomycetota bacterium]|nr:sulfatase-like hydrolase/transferase [Planctomycetota bacterium]
MNNLCPTMLASTLLLASPYVSAASQTQSTSQKPNVVLILADDLGSADLSVLGCRDIQTSNIDSIAQKGITFTQAYVTGAVCGPSRAGLITGRNQQRFGFEDNPGPFRRSVDTRVGLDLNERTIADRLKPLGYKTGMVGKWHDGDDADFQPPARGFDEFYGFNNGAQRYLNVDSSNTPMMRGKQPEKHGAGYLTDTFGRESAEFIERNHDQPFFLFLSFNAPHGPMTARPDILEKYKHIEDIGRRRYVAMIHSMDVAVGSVLEKLREHNLEDNTMIIFLSDHGGVKNKKASWSDNGILRNGKGTLWDGGIRTPILIQWKPMIDAGTTYTLPVSSLDLLPTIVATCGGKVEPEWELDGVNLLPFIDGKKTERPHQTLYWRQNEMWAMRDGDWKIFKDRGNVEPKLFNLAKDPSEQRNLANENSEKLSELEAKYYKWDASVEKPRFGWWKKIGPRIENK